MNSFLQCQRKHFWRYEVGLQSTDKSDALRFGSAWATALEARWNGKPSDEALALALPDDKTFDAYQVATLTAMLNAYYLKHQEEPMIERILPEQEFKHAVAGVRGFEAAGKMDGIGVLRNGKLCIVESKTTSESIDLGADYWIRLRNNIQLLQYVYAARLNGWDIHTIIYDVAKKPMLKPCKIPVLDENGLKVVLDSNGNRALLANGKPRQSGTEADGLFMQTRIETDDEYFNRLSADIAERPDFYFARREVPVLDIDVEEFVAQRKAICAQIRTNRKMKVARPEHAWPVNVSRLCNVMCEYHPFCLQNTTINVSQPPIGFTIGEKNNELTVTPTV